MGLTLEPMPGRLNDRAAQSLVLSAQPASAINVQNRLHPKPCCASPSAETHASGVVIRKDNVTNGVRNESVAPTMPHRRENTPSSVSRPIVISTVPRPSEKP